MRASRGLLILFLFIAPLFTVAAEVNRVGGTQTFVGLSSDTKPSADEGSTYIETDTGKKWLYDGSSWVVQAVSSVTDTTTLRAPGYSSAVWCGGGYTKLLWYFTVASINTSVGVVLQAKKGNSGWTNVFADSLVYTANGSYGLEWENVALADSVRFRFYSEGGGTDALITHNVALAGGN